MNWGKPARGGYVAGGVFAGLQHGTSIPSLYEGKDGILCYDGNPEDYDPLYAIDFSQIDRAAALVEVGDAPPMCSCETGDAYPPPDCEDVCNSPDPAYVDQCGACVGGTTGLNPCVADCAGELRDSSSRCYGHTGNGHNGITQCAHIYHAAK